MSFSSTEFFFSSPLKACSGFEISASLLIGWNACWSLGGAATWPPSSTLFVGKTSCSKVILCVRVCGWVFGSCLVQFPFSVLTEKDSYQFCLKKNIRTMRQTKILYLYTECSSAQLLLHENFTNATANFFPFLVNDGFFVSTICNPIHVLSKRQTVVQHDSFWVGDLQLVVWKGIRGIQWTKSTGQFFIPAEI